MYEGDCRYIFPTFVTVYGVQDQNGPGKICACKTIACNLPWDPEGWSRSCMQELGCFEKPTLRSAGPFCNVLPGHRRSVKVRFVPMEFSKQSFWRPGFVAIVEHWEQDRSDNRVLSRKVSKHIINPGRRSAVFEGILGRKDEYQWHTKGWANEQEEEQWAISEEEKSYSFSVAGTEYYLKARRVQDSVCVKYYGGDKDMSTEIFEECLPIPQMELPRIYQTYNITEETVKKGEEHIKKHCKSSAAVKTEHLTNKGGSEYNRISFIRDATTEITRNANSVPSKFSRAFVQHFTKQNSGGWTVSEEKIVDNSAATAWYKKHITDKQHSALKEKSWSEHDTCARKLEECVTFSGKHTCIDVTNSKGRDYLQSVLGPHRTRNNTHPVVDSYYKHPIGGFWGYSSINDLQKKVEHYVAKEHGGNVHHIKFVGMAATPNRELGGICSDPEDGSGECGYHVVTDAPKVMCITGIESGADTSEYEVTSSDDGISRTWLRKQPKMLRRYMLAGGDSDARRIACDDKYSVNLNLLSQTILDETVIKNGKFVLPRKFLGTSVDRNSSDFCARADSNTAYYYEPGKFITGSDSLAGCMDPITQYYAPKKKIEGCVYEYTSLDDYRPMSLSQNIGAELEGSPPSLPPIGGNKISGNSPTMRLQPLSLYDRGLCVDSFPRYWYEPEYKVENGKPETVAREYVVLKFEASNSRTTTTQQNRKWCHFYKIEAWGGGEAAARTETGEQRSGRPGQYVVGVLRNPDSDGKYDCNVFSQYKQDGRTPKLSDLEFSIKVDIGEGGEHDKPKKQESALKQHYIPTKNTGNYGSGVKGAGGDTVVKFCTKKKNHSGQHTNTHNNSANTETCHEIMRAVGGGSTDVGVLNTNAIRDLMVSYRTITGDVLASDDMATKLLLEGRAMFTKFPLEMNFPLTGEKRHVLETKEYFEGRSLPQELCRKKSRYSKWRGDSVFVPGMGGCWGREDKDDGPGLGESGAVMVTCEQWDIVAPMAQPRDLGLAEPKRKPEAEKRHEKATDEAQSGQPSTSTEVRKLQVEKPQQAPKRKSEPAKPQWPQKKKYLYCPWYAWWTISSWNDHYSCTGGLREYEEVFNSQRDYDDFLRRQYKVRYMHGCDDERCAHFLRGYTNNSNAKKYEATRRRR
ncbi:hypothetical protein [Anaplasma capra]|uniref:hypothetical protein n=1 Tax=Anaplasma capra TaxID=1562740 RepID=UPI0021D5F4CC|nr:hypothetical protein [Anaplasma capra]